MHGLNKSKINYSISDKPRKPHNTFLLATFLHHGQARRCLYNMFNQQRRGGPCTTAEARTCYLPVHTAPDPPPPLLFLPNNTLRAFVFAAKTKAARSRETNQATFSCMVTVANAGLDGDLLQLRGLTKAPVQRLPSTSFSASASIRSTHLFYFCFFLHNGLNWHRDGQDTSTGAS